MKPALSFAHVAADTLITIVYFLIPAVLLFFVRSRKDVPLRAPIAALAAFMVACGLTHAFETWTLQHGDDRIAAAFETFAIVASLVAGFVLLRIIPKPLTFRSSSKLAALLPSEERYAELAEALQQIVWTSTPQGDIDYYNQRWFDYTGMTFEETGGWGSPVVVHPADSQRCVETWQASLSGGTPYEVECRLKRASDGTYRWHLGRALPICDAGGTIVKWLGTCTDIDDQKRALKTQTRLAEQLQFIVDATDRLTNALDTREAVQTLCELIVPRFADWLSVNAVEADGRIRNMAVVHADPSKAEAVAELHGTYYVDPAASGVIAKILVSKEPSLTTQYVVTYEGLEPIVADKRDAILKLGLNSVISAPLLVRGRVVAVLSTVWAQSDHRYSEIEVPFFQELANRAAVAFDDAAPRSLARAKEEIARRIMQSSTDCIAILDLESALISVNESGAATFAASGIALEPGCDWLACWRTEDRAAAGQALVAAAAGSTGTYQGCLCGESNAPQWWDVVVTPITNVDRKPTQLLAVARNITRQKTHESTLEAIAERYRAFANAIPAIAFTADARGTLDFVNDRWTEYTGLSDRASLQEGLRAVTHDDERPALTAEWFAALEAGRTRETETRLRRAADGVYRWHLMRAVPIRDDRGRIVQWFGTGTDIEDQKRAEASLGEARDAALEAAKLKSQFVATMSHEIRTPISGVIGMTELLLVTKLSDEQREYANVVRDSGQSLLRVINDILDYSKLDAGKLQLEFVEFDVAMQIKSVTDLLRAQSESKRITLTSHIAASVPATLVGDPGRVRQILVNLVGNAVKFTPPGGRVTVDVRCRPANADTVRVRFEIRDTGAGITADIRDRLFLPFSQGDGSTTRKFGGTGLGLSICKQLVSIMDGAIGVDSQPGEGASFWFSVDFRRAATSAYAQPLAADERDGRHASNNVGEHKILLVEDNEINTLLAQRQFEQLGYRITTVGNGREAVDAVRTTAYDLVFMDCHMPEMDGFAATREIRRLEAGAAKRLPIVAMTADAQIEDQTACLAAGMDDYLPKPTNLRQLGEVLRRWLSA